MNRVYVSALSKSSGKTMLSTGLCAALRAQGLLVQPYKKGPDYIDPLWLGVASTRDCVNLDFHTMHPDEIVASMVRPRPIADMAVIEGNKGLHDGVHVDGRDSNAALAKLLGAPVILVVDTAGVTRGVAPLVNGHRDFDPGVNVAAVILNKVGGPRHESKLRDAIERYCNVPVVGALPRSPDVALDERHLGLVPTMERDDARAFAERLGRLVARHVDLQAVQHIAATAPPVPAPDIWPCAAQPPLALRIGIARDAAFGFYYAQDLAALNAAGATLVPVDTLNDSALPAVDGLFIGGGFPEVHMDALAANTGFRRSLRAAIRAGLPVYAECGGLMYLARSITWGNARREMVGALDADVTVHPRPQGRGYMVLEETADCPWPYIPGAGPATIRCHEFHHGSLHDLGGDVRFAYRVLRGHGIDGAHDGLVHRNVLGSFAHLRDVDAHRWTRRFLEFVHHCARASFPAAAC